MKIENANVAVISLYIEKSSTPLIVSVQVWVFYDAAVKQIENQEQFMVKNTESYFHWFHL